MVLAVGQAIHGEFLCKPMYISCTVFRRSSGASVSRQAQGTSVAWSTAGQLPTVIKSRLPFNETARSGAASVVPAINPTLRASHAGSQLSQGKPEHPHDCSQTPVAFRSAVLLQSNPTSTCRVGPPYLVPLIPNRTDVCSTIADPKGF